MDQRQSSNLCLRILCAEQQRSGFYEQILPIYISGFADVIHCLIGMPVYLPQTGPALASARPDLEALLRDPI